jgi:3-oxoacyl-[acyl-carrier protein] reductase
MIIVTGASRGLGRAICERLLKRDVEVMGVARSVEKLPFRSYSCDVSSYEGLKAMVGGLKREGVVIEGLVNAAGIASMNLAVTTPHAVTQRLINVNLLGTIYCCQLIAPMMVRHRQGSIINFSTIAVPLGLKGESVYVASKAGVEGFSRTFAREMADFDIKVNCIAPGPIDTSLLSGVTPVQIANIIGRQIIPKKFTPDTVSDLVEILLDPRAAALSGQVLHVGGA